MISPIPYRHIVIDTYLNADKAASILSSALGSLYYKPSIFRWFRGNPRDFKGTVSSDEFKIKRVYPPFIHDSFLPVLYGRFNPHEQGTQIDVQITLRPLTLIVLIIFFCSGAYYIISYAADWISTKTLDNGFVYTLVIMLIGYGFMILSFNHQADIAADFIQRTYRRHVE